MRILLATSFVPFHDGGASLLFDWLHCALERSGHAVERVLLPFDSRPDEYLEQLLGWRCIDLNGRGDVLITMRTPSYLLRHDCKIAWFIHHHRAAYDLWGTRYASIADTPDGRRLQAAIQASDNVALRECAAIFANSPIVARRLRRYNRIEAEVLYPPVLDAQRYCNKASGDSIVYISRLTEHKRQHLAIEAMRFTQTPVKLVIAGAPENATYAALLERTAADSPAREQIDLRIGWLPETEKERLVSTCVAVAYLPYDEDSYGFPILEGALAAKPAVTVKDAGGSAEFVSSEACGLVVDPDPRALARAFDRLYLQREEATRFGQAGTDAVAKHDINWEHAVERLLAPARRLVCAT